MLFNLEYDHGDTIEGYLIPDGFSDEPNIKVIRDDGTVVSFRCSHSRPAVVQSGRHATGIVGFRIDLASMPDISQQKNLAVHDAKSGLLIYRRAGGGQPLAMKILRLELKMRPMIKFDEYCGRLFQYELSAVERFGHETALQAFHLNGVASIYISGRLQLRNYEEFLDKGFQVIADIPEPYYEMASRLVMLKSLARGRIAFIGERDRMFLQAAAEHFADVNFEDERQLMRAFKRMPDKARDVLASPTTRQLVCNYPEQHVTHREVAPAIDMLSRFAVVGYGDDNTHFQDAVGELLDVAPMDIPVPARNSVMRDLATRLRQLPIAELLLEEDLILDHYLRQAMVPHISRTC